jgi:hypothetical protein
VQAGLGEVAITITRPIGRVGLSAGHRLGLAAMSPVVERAPQALCFVCGPPLFVDDLVTTLSQLGVRADRIRREDW